MDLNLVRTGSMNVVMRKALFTSVLVVGTLFAVQAGNNLPAGIDDEISVTSRGISDGLMTFNLKLDNNDGDKIEIAIVDQDGNKIFREVFSDKTLNKTFKTPSDMGSVVLIITNIKERTSQKFEITSERRLVEEVQVTSLH